MRNSYKTSPPAKRISRRGLFSGTILEVRVVFVPRKKLHLLTHSPFRNLQGGNKKIFVAAFLYSIYSWLV